MEHMAEIGILGAGTWGMALARLLSNSGHGVHVWSALKEEIDQLTRDRRQKNLPGMDIPESIRFTKEMGEVCQGKDILLFAVPSVFVRATARQAAPYYQKKQIIVDVAKGIEKDTLMTLSEVIKSEIPQAVIVALSGPTHAEEVARDLPTTVVSACEDTTAAEKVQAVFMNDVLRVYTNTDIKGVELCGALKNIMALASGISSGLGYGDNTKAALITRGLAEMERLGIQMGCRKETFAGLAGVGDLIVTSTSEHSRNYRCGRLIGRGYASEDAVREVGMVVEGINAIPAAMTLMRKHGVEMPITAAVDAIVRQGADPRETVLKLMRREKTMETF